MTTKTQAKRTMGKWVVKPHPDKRRNVIWITAPLANPSSMDVVLGAERMICELYGQPDHSDADVVQANGCFITHSANLHDELVEMFDWLLVIAECDANTLENAVTIQKAQALSRKIGMPTSFLAKAQS